MLPPPLLGFIRRIIKKTNAGDLRWHFDDVNSSISIRDKEFQMDARYNFNENKEIGEFMIFYRSMDNPTEYRFYTDQYAEDEYELMQRLFNAAQGSEAKFPF